MSHRFNGPTLRYAAYLGLASLALACSKKSGGSDPAPVAPPVAVTTTKPVVPPSVAPSTSTATNTTPTTGSGSNVAGSTDVTAQDGSGSGGSSTVVGGGGGGGGSSTTVVANPPPPAPLSLQIGSFYAFLVPDGMHVTEYTTTKTYNGTLDFIRVSPQSDPVYLGNYACDGTFDNSKAVSLAGPNGHVYQYCDSTPQERQYKKWMTSNPLANNHLEVATNIENVTNENQTYIDINVFDTDYEYMYGESRFEKLCQNSIGGISSTPAGAAFFAGYNFWDLPMFTQFVMCQVAIQLPTGAAFNGIDTHLWRNVVSVGSFMLTSATGSTPATLPDPNCFKNRNCAPYSNANLLELTIVSKTPYTDPAFFAHDAQSLLIPHLQRIVP